VLFFVGVWLVGWWGVVGFFVWCVVWGAVFGVGGLVLLGGVCGFLLAYPTGHPLFSL